MLLVGGHSRLSGPVKNDALGPARRRARAGARLPALGRRHICLRLRRRPVPRDKHGFHGPTNLLRQGVRFLAGGPRRRRRWPGRSRCPRGCAGRTAARRSGRNAAALKQDCVLRLTPNAHFGVRGQNWYLSLISVAERNQHRHSMTPGRLAAVKDRGRPPILHPAPDGLPRTKSAPPASACAAAAHMRRRP